jgi:fumarate reductase flavoprotein subunit
VTEPLFRQAMAAGRITLLLDTGAAELVQDKSGAVIGVTAEDEAGRLTDYMARNVLIACGGCASNPRMYEDLHGVPLTSQIAYPFSQGMGFTLGLGAGGYLRGGENYIGSFGGLLSDDNYPASVDGSFEHHPEIRQPWEIYVNARGERFMREDHPSIDYREKALCRQPGQRMWVVADQAMVDKAPPWFPKWSQEKFFAAFGTHPMFVKAETLTALAVKAGIEPRGLAGAVAGYNAALAEGLPDAHGRTHRPVPYGKGPFYAVRLTATQLKSFAGLAIDAKLRVIRRDGSAIKGLYAAGEVIGGGVTGGAAYTNGSMVTPAITFGRMVGQRIMSRDA